MTSKLLYTWARKELVKNNEMVSALVRRQHTESYWPAR